uniref:Uncharacterized protein n=1 Tax=Arundo donax TaxID=35708 RepID=A0A0A9ELN4_ARUDO
MIFYMCIFFSELLILCSRFRVSYITLAMVISA